MTMTDLHTIDAMGSCGLTQEEALLFHMDTRFYPPLLAGHKASIRQGFVLYWQGDIDEEELAQYCYVRDTDTLYKYFNCFMMDDEL